MRLRHSALYVLKVAFLFPCISAVGLEADIATGKRLLSEGDALADKGETTEATIRYKQAFEQLLPKMRKIPFKHEVKRDVTRREDMKAMLIKEIDADITPAEFRGDELGLKALGFLPREFDLKEAMVRVYSEEIAAFYDPKTKTMHLIREPEAKAKTPPTLLQKLFGKTDGFDKEENKTTIAHELTHALADQNYNIQAMQSAIKHNDDRDLALSALIEGEATLTMLGAQMNDWNGREIINVPAERLDRVFSLLAPFMPLTGGASLREAPVILSETLIFPYLRGLVFCAQLTNDGGWKALDDAYKRPPLSTEQVLHPEKYQSPPDFPTSIDFGKLETIPRWIEAGRNVVGEMQLAILLRRHGGKPAAAGWDGDAYAVFEGPGGRLGLVWLTTWDSADDAREFASGYIRYQAAKVGIEVPPWENGTGVDRTIGETRYVVDQRGNDVAIVEGFPYDATETLRAAAFRARKSELTFEAAANQNGRPGAAQ
jgi:hypothetical protein